MALYSLSQHQTSSISFHWRSRCSRHTNKGAESSIEVTQIATTTSQDFLMVMRVRKGLTTHRSQSEESTISE